MAEPLVQIKVLRLSRPQLHTQSASEGASLFTPELILHKSSQAVYVGERASLLLSVNAIGDAQVTIHAEAEIIGPLGHRSPAVSGSAQLDASAASAAWTQLVEFEPLETGQHALQVIAQYQSGTETRQVRKSFKFEATAAISVRTKASRNASVRVLEAQVENLTDSALTIESCSLNPAHDWAVHPISETGSTLLKPRDVHQWCFLMDNGTRKEVGQVCVGWRREPLGAKGLQTTGVIQI